MKHIYLFLLLAAATLNAQQISLFDELGEPVAYIDYKKDATLFLWDGTPAGFLTRDGRDSAVFGFNKTFLGWLVGGVLYDRQGQKVVAVKDELDRFARYEGIKGIQGFVPIKPIVPMAPIRPVLRFSWTESPAFDYLKLGVR